MDNTGRDQERERERERYKERQREIKWQREKDGKRL